jgi:hypothetical protein
MANDAAFLYGFVTCATVVAVCWIAFRQGYLYARRLKNLGVELNHYEPVAMFEKSDAKTSMAEAGRHA